MQFREQRLVLVVDTNPHTKWQTVQILISWLNTQRLNKYNVPSLFVYVASSPESYCICLKTKLFFFYQKEYFI